MGVLSGHVSLANFLTSVSLDSRDRGQSGRSADARDRLYDDVQYYCHVRPTPDLHGRPVDGRSAAITVIRNLSN